MNQVAAPAHDRELVRGFLDTGDTLLFQELVDRYKDRVFRLCVSVLGRGAEMEAEEAAQDAFVQAYRKLDGFRGEGAFGTWLYRIAYNAAVDRRRSAGRRRRELSDVELVERPAGAESDPFSAAVSRQQAEVFRGCLDDLPDLYRTALHLHYWMGWSVDEIGQALGAPANTVKSYLHRGRARLEALLRGKGIHHV